MSFDDDTEEHDVVMCDCSHCENRRRAAATHPLVSCRCGKNFEASDWNAAELVGYQPDGAGGLLELRNCTCGSTHSIELAPSSTRYPEALLSAIERLVKLAPGRTITIESDGKVVYVRAGSPRGPLAHTIGESLEDALQASVEALPPATNPKANELLALVSDREPFFSAERDTRETP